MALDKVGLALQNIKPTEVLLQGWQKALTPIFTWKAENLHELSKIDIEPFLIRVPTVEDIPKLKAMDDKLKELKKLAAAKEKERKDLTSPLDGVKKNLMLIEDSYMELYKEIEPCFIALSKIKREEEGKVAARNSELAEFRLKCQQWFNKQENNWNIYSQEKVTEAYREALEKIEAGELNDYLSGILEKHQPSQFKMLVPGFSAADVRDEQKMAIWKEVTDKWDSNRLASEFSSLLNSTFVNFAIAKSQKEEAIKQREAEQIVETVAINEEMEMNNTLAVIEEKSTDVTPTYEATRQLKTVYAIDMEHTEANMRQINKAFYSNMKECLAIWQGKDCWTINTVDQGNLLSKLKNKDNEFQPDGIVFKEIDKI